MHPIHACQSMHQRERESERATTRKHKFDALSAEPVTQRANCAYLNQFLLNGASQVNISLVHPLDEDDISLAESNFVAAQFVVLSVKGGSARL